MIYPNINPVAIDFGFFQIYWYGVAYLLAFMSAYLLANQRTKNNKQWDKKQVEDLIFFGAMGVVLGGRIGYILFYQFSSFIDNPLVLFKVWQGGMSFHGGILGVALAIFLFAKKYNKGFLQITDFVVVLVPLGLFFGRIANFINSELWGKITESSFGMYIPSENVSRYPSQLYEATLEGLVLFLIVWFYSQKPRKLGRMSALFLMGYGCFRFLVEFVRMPDAHLGYLAFNWLTMGQILTIPMFVLGIFLWIRK
ncbi:Prolipoprotein diacylglyceryl transferase [hydrothermal vent metagenome]|uniref:Prolipoprotein diacylglyceryl transferase n=1 Tax=hydrothermal vent metagenome TaxID=652676 RepID=A0A1W1BN92_9ZZZZ